MTTIIVRFLRMLDYALARLIDRPAPHYYLVYRSDWESGQIMYFPWHLYTNERAAWLVCARLMKHETGRGNYHFTRIVAHTTPNIHERRLDDED